MAGRGRKIFCQARERRGTRPIEAIPGARLRPAAIFNGPESAAGESPFRTLFFMGDLIVVLAERVLTKVVFEITPHRMNVVGIILRVVIFE